MESASEPLVANPETPLSSRTADVQFSRRSYPAIVHAVCISAFLLPIAFIPYFLARRQIVSLQHKDRTLERAIQQLRNDLNVAASHQRNTNSEVRYLRTTLQESLKGSATLRHRIHRQEVDLIKSTTTIQKDISKLLDGVQRSRSQMDDIIPLGKSLADIAAFMQEVEMRLALKPSDQTHDQRGIERLRSLALRLHLLHQSQQPNEPKKPQEYLEESGSP